MYCVLAENFHNLFVFASMTHKLDLFCIGKKSLILMTNEIHAVFCFQQYTKILFNVYNDIRYFL